MSQDNRLYVAGISWNTTDEGFKAFFSAFGGVSSAMIMRESSGRSRGFGFVTYEDSSSVDSLMQQQRQLDGRKLDIKAAQSKDELATTGTKAPKSSSKKLYVAGIAWSLTDDDLFNYFAKYGEIERAEIMKDKATGKSRGFGFVTFSQDGGVTGAIDAQAQTPLELGGRKLDIKVSLPRGSSGLAQGEAPPAADDFGRQMPVQQMAYGRPVPGARGPAPYQQQQPYQQQPYQQQRAPRAPYGAPPPQQGYEEDYGPQGGQYMPRGGYGAAYAPRPSRGAGGAGYHPYSR